MERDCDVAFYSLSKSKFFKFLIFTFENNAVWKSYS
jgi:hypothetical protein